ncbi:CTD kinase subunit gamma CTK3-domain-containing protein [Glomus cerebriforme]|uniref:CTD kinase subunit gamma CTK3-domain-containing protein n=1 Tax=Glomus cerebriforme TaxID=658196 RepID=A0A397TQP2_9GLOM|nr:CTD kinase subunit gamma CTK3-domain-containing protein [Glomus cerebriforme]
MSVTVPEYIDAFDARLYFVSSLKKLSVSQQTILKCRSFALRYTDWYEDLYRCIIEVMEGGNVWSRMYLLYFLDSLIERSELVNFKGYTEFILEDIEKIVGLVCKKPEGSVNLVNTLKTLERWQNKKFFDPNVIGKAKASLLAWKSEPEYPPELILTGAEIKQRMEDDRERAKLLREDSWWVDKSIEDGEALALWEETSDLDEGDYLDIITENIKQDPNFEWKSLYEEVTAWNKEQTKLEKELEKEDERIAAMNYDFEPVIHTDLLSKIPRPDQVNSEKYKDQVSKNSEVPSKIPRLRKVPSNILINMNSEEESLHETKEKISEFESMITSASSTFVATPIINVASIAENRIKVNSSVPAIVISPPNQTEIIPISPEKSGTKRIHGADDTFPGISDEQSKPKRARPAHEDPSTTLGTKESDFQELSDQNSSHVNEEENIRDSEEAEVENSNSHAPESNLEFLLQAVELVSPMTEVSLSKEDSPSRDDFHLIEKL